MTKYLVAILGSEGFIGRNVRESCIKAGIPVINLEKWSGDYIRFSLRLHELKAAHPNSEIILIQAAWYSTNNENYRTSVENKLWVEISRAIIEICKEQGIIFAGLGTCLEKLDLDDDIYSMSKSEIQRILSGNFKSDEWIWFQIHYVYSAQDLKPAVVKRASEAVASGRDLKLETPNDVHDFIEVRDAADAIVHSIIKGLRGIVDIGTGTTTEVSKLLKAIFPNVQISKQEVNKNRISYQGAASVGDLAQSGWKTKFSIL